MTRPAGARRGDDDLSRRPRDHGECAGVDSGTSSSQAPGGRAKAARGGRSRARAGACRRSTTCPALTYCRAGGHRVDAAVSAGVDHRPPRGRRLPDRRVRRSGPVASSSCSPYLIQRDARWFPDPTRSIPIAGRRSSRRRCRRLPTCRSAAAHAAASASRSPGWSWCSWPAPSRSVAAAASCRAIRSCRSRSSRFA